MQFALLIYESPEAFATRNSDGTDPYTGAWRAYHKSLVKSGSYLGGEPLQVPEIGTTVRLKEGKRRVQDGPFADTKEQLGGSGSKRVSTPKAGQSVVVWSSSDGHAGLQGIRR
jgi:hypothetical protein